MRVILVKRLVISLSVMLEVLGLVLIAYGIFFVSTTTPAEQFSGVLFVILGIIIIIMTIFGLLAAVHEKPVCLMLYMGVLLLMIRIQVVFISVASLLEDEFNEKIRQASSYTPIFVPNQEAISDLKTLINWFDVLKIVCWLLIVGEGCEAIFACLLSRIIRKERARLTANPIPSVLPLVQNND